MDINLALQINLVLQIVLGLIFLAQYFATRHHLWKEGTAVVASAILLTLLSEDKTEAFVDRMVLYFWYFIHVLNTWRMVQRNHDCWDTRRNAFGKKNLRSAAIKYLRDMAKFRFIPLRYIKGLLQEFSDDEEILLLTNKLVIFNFDDDMRIRLVLEEASTRLRNDKHFVIQMVKADRRNLQFASLQVRGDPAVVLEFALLHCEALEYATDELKSDKAFMLKAVDINGNCLEYAHDDLRNDKEIVWNAIWQDGWAIEYASPDLQSNRDFVMIAIENGYDLEGEIVDDDLRNDEEVVSLAVWNQGYALRCASQGLQNNKIIVLMAVRKNANVVEYASPRLRDDIDVALAVVRRDGLALRYVSPRLQNHKQVVMEAVSKDGYALLYASDGLKNDKQVVLEAIRVSKGWAFEDASPDLRNDKQVVMEALSGNGLNLEFASPRFQNHRHAVMKAVLENQNAIEFASDTLQRDIEIVLICELRELGLSLPNNVDELPFFLEKANDHPHIIYHCLIDRNNLIIEASNKKSMTSSQDCDVIKHVGDESNEVDGGSSSNHQATNNPFLGYPSNTRRRSKRTRTSSGQHNDEKAKKELHQIEKEDPLVVAERVFVQIKNLNHPILTSSCGSRSAVDG